MYCAKCGANVPDGASVCPVCGLAVLPQETAAPEAGTVSPAVPPAESSAEGQTQPAQEAPLQPEGPPAFQQVTYIPDKAIYAPEQSVYGSRYSASGYNRYVHDQNRAALAQSRYPVYGQNAYGYGYDPGVLSYDQNTYSYDQNANGYGLYPDNNGQDQTPAGAIAAEENAPADSAAAPEEAAASTADATFASAFDSAYPGDYYGSGDYYATGDAYDSGAYFGIGENYGTGNYIDNYGYDPNATYSSSNPIYIQPEKQPKKKKKQKVKLKWFKFLIYFHFFWFAVTSIIYGIFLLVDGFTLVLNAVLDHLRSMPLFEQDGPLLDSLGEIFGEIFSSMRVYGIILAVITILMAVFGLIVRKQLAKRKTVGPKMLNVFFMLRMVFKILANGLAVFFFGKGFVSFLEEFPYMTYLYIVPFAIMIPSALVTLLVLLLSRKYFNKRKEIFNQPVQSVEEPTNDPSGTAGQDDSASLNEQPAEEAVTAPVL